MPHGVPHTVFPGGRRPSVLGLAGRHVDTHTSGPIIALAHSDKASIALAHSSWAAIVLSLALSCRASFQRTHGLAVHRHITHTFLPATVATHSAGLAGYRPVAYTFLPAIVQRHTLSYRMLLYHALGLAGHRSNTRSGLPTIALTHVRPFWPSHCCTHGLFGIVPTHTALAAIALSHALSCRPSHYHA